MSEEHKYQLVRLLIVRLFNWLGNTDISLNTDRVNGTVTYRSRPVRQAQRCLPQQFEE